jgi:hypothetical protein
MAKTTLIGKEYYEELKKASEEGISENSFFKKALTYDTPTSGKEFIPVNYSAQIITQVYERAWHRQTIPTFVMSTTKEKIPKFSDMAVAQYLSASITSTDPANQIALSSRNTTDVEIELKTLTMNLMVDNKFLAYDVSPQIEGMLRETLISEMVESEVDLLINGDDTNPSHQDSDVSSASDRRKAFKGLRKLAGVTYDNNGDVFKISTVNRMQEKLGRYGRGRVNDLVLLVSPAVARQLRDTEQLQTLDKSGPQATILTGEAGKVNGISTIETGYVRSDLNASGVYDGESTDKTIAILFNPNFLYWGVPSVAERTLNLKIWDDPRFDRKQLIIVEDIGFVAQHNGAICVAYNIATDDDESPSESP